MKKLLSTTFDKIIEKYKEMEKFKNLLNYLETKFNYQIDDLLNFYLK